MRKVIQVMGCPVCGSEIPVPVAYDAAGVTGVDLDRFHEHVRDCVEEAYPTDVLVSTIKVRPYETVDDVRAASEWSGYEMVEDNVYGWCLKSKIGRMVPKEGWVIWKGADDEYHLAGRNSLMQRYNFEPLREV